MKKSVKKILLFPIKLAVSSVVGIGLLTEALKKKYENK